MPAASFAELETVIANDFSNDASAQMLSKLLDNNWWQIVPGTSSDSGTAASMLFPMLGEINLACLTVVTVFFSYFIGIGLVGTAHDGSPLGKSYHSWWPIARFGFSISALAPVAKGGLCIFQVLLLAGIGGSLKIADSLWDTALKYLNETGGQLVATVPDSVYDETHQIAGGMLKSITLQKFYEKKWDKTVQGKSETVDWVVDDEDGTRGTYKFYFQPPEDTPLTKEDMGGITFYCPNIANDEVVKTCNARVTAASRLVSDLMPIASELVGDEDGNRVLDIEAYEKAIKTYNSAIATNLGGFIATSKSKFSEELKAFLATSEEDGWITAGSYFWTLSRLNGKAQSVLMTTSSYIEPRDAPGGFNERFKGFEALGEKVDELRREKFNSRLSSAGAGADPNDWQSMVSSIFRPLLQGAIDLISGSKNETLGLEAEDPIARIASAGHLMIGAIEAGAAAMAGSWLLTKTGADSVAGKLAGYIPGAAALKSLAVHAVELASFIFMGCAIPLLVVACTFAYYLPALPYILWTCAVVGWMIVLIEALVAAPFWVAAHAMPEGEGIAGSAGKQGYMLLLSVLARPALMIVGFMTALVLLEFIGPFICQTYLLAEASMNAGNTLGLIGSACMLILFGGIITVLSHKIFGLITHLPDTCLNWIGQQFHNLTSDQDEARTRGVFSQAGAQSHTMAQGVGRMMGERLRQGRVGDDGGGGPGGGGGGARATAELKQGEAQAIGHEDADWEKKKA